MNYFDQIIKNSEDNILKLLDKKSFNLDHVSKMALFKRNVEIINLELSYQCNRRCDYCPVTNSGRKNIQQYISDKLFEKIVKELAQIRYENRISLNLYNEPLLDKDFENKISFIRELLPYSHIAFNSNGDLLTRDRFINISNSGCNAICITLHPPQNKNLSASIIYKRVSAIISILEVAELPQFDPEEQSSIQVSSRGVKLKIQWPDWRVNGSSRGGIIDRLNLATIRNKPCIKPFREFTIYYDGVIQPCCESFYDGNSKNIEIGNVSEQTIFDLYLSRNLTKFRRHVFDFGEKSGICKYCSVADYTKLEDSDTRKHLLVKSESHSEN